MTPVAENSDCLLFSMLHSSTFLYCLRLIHTLKIFLWFLQILFTQSAKILVMYYVFSRKPASNRLKTRQKIHAAFVSRDIPHVTCFDLVGIFLSFYHMTQIPTLCQLVTNQRPVQHPRDQHEFETQNRAEFWICFPGFWIFSPNLHFSNQMNINCYLHLQP